jgi:hypothetical protein
MIDSSGENSFLKIEKIDVEVRAKWSKLHDPRSSAKLQEVCLMICDLPFTLHGLAGRQQALPTPGSPSILPQCAASHQPIYRLATMAIKERHHSRKRKDNSGELMAAENRPFPARQG